MGESDKNGVVFKCKRNNPFNIRKSFSRWKGLTERGSDGGFCEFVDVRYGIRAYIILIHNYIHIRVLRTVRQIISTYAPSSENDTEAYIKYVCFSTGFDEDEILKDRDIIDLGVAMSIMEGNPQRKDFITKIFYETVSEKGWVIH